MTRKRFYELAVLLVFIFWLLNAIVFFYAKCYGGYLQTKSVWGETKTVSKSVYLKEKQIIEQLPKDMETALDMVNARIDYMNSDDAWKKFKNHEFEKEDLEVYREVKKNLEAAAGYGDYIKNLDGSTEDISKILLPLGDNQNQINNIAKSKMDHLGLEYISFGPILDYTVNMTLQYHVTDVFSVVFCLLMSGIFFYYISNQQISESVVGKKRLSGTLILIIICLTGMYATNLIIINHIYGLPFFAEPVQALMAFYTCEYPISIGGMVWITYGIRLIAVLVIYGICITVLMKDNRKKASLYALCFFIIELVLSIEPGQNQFLQILREINIFSGFTSERFFNRYLNLNIGNFYFSRFPIFIFFICTLTFISLYASFKTVTATERKRQKELELAYYAEIDNSYKETRRLWHDFNNHLLAIKTLYEFGKNEEASQYIDELTKEARNNLVPAKTGLEVLDLLFFKKNQQAKEKDVEIAFSISCNLSKFNIAILDFCSMLGNLLDNAIEAASKIDDKDKKIELKISEQNSMIFIMCKNPYSGERIKNNGVYETTKANKLEHGIGLTSVKQICKKYQGSMDIENSDGMFIVKILMNEGK